MKPIAIFGIACFLINSVFAGFSSSSSSSGSDTSDSENLISDFELPEPAITETEVEFDVSTGISLDQVAVLRNGFLEKQSNKILMNASNFVDLKELMENADVAENTTQFQYLIANSFFAYDWPMMRPSIFASTLALLRVKIKCKYPKLSPFFSLSPNYLMFHAYFETGLRMIQKLSEVAHEGIESESVRKIIEFDFRNPHFTIDQMLEVVEKYGIVPSNLYEDPLENTIFPETESDMNSFIFETAHHFSKIPSEMISKAKEERINALYRHLCLQHGIPPKEFSYKLPLREKKTKTFVKFENITPKEFYIQSGARLRNRLVQFGYDPSLEMGKMYTYADQKCLTEGKGFTFLNIDMEMINKIALQTLMSKRLVHFTFFFSGHESGRKKLLDRDLFLFEDFLGVPRGLSRTDILSLRHKSLNRSSGLFWGVSIDKVTGAPTQWNMESVFHYYVCVRNNYFLENGLTISVEDKYLDPEILKMIDSDPIIISNEFSKLA